jgi:glycine/D-amino acid oxidase-like deaminating enzyme
MYKEKVYLLPDLNIEIEYRYCGAFASTQDNLGFLGKDPSNEKLWYCLGYGANGILFAILGGMMLSKLYLGEEVQDLKLFDVGRFDN